MVRRELVLSIGAFDERLRQNEDLDCFLRIVARCPFVIVERPLVRRRIHEQNNSNDSVAAMSFLQIVEQMVTEIGKISCWSGKRLPDGSLARNDSDEAFAFA